MEEKVDLSKTFEQDKEYIRTEILAQQPNGAYTKWSRELKAVSVIDITYSQYIDYWVKRYKNYPEYIDELVKICEDTLDNKVIHRSKMIEMIENSNDFESEKVKAITALGGKYKPKEI